MDKQIKVIDVLTPYRIVMNTGTDDGIKVGDKYLIYGVGEMMKDPDSGEELEKIEIPRGKGKVIHVQKKICLVESYEIEKSPKTIKRTHKGMTAMALGLYPNTEEIETQNELLPFDEVQIGDLSKKI